MTNTDIKPSTRELLESLRLLSERDCREDLAPAQQRVCFDKLVEHGWAQFEEAPYALGYWVITGEGQEVLEQAEVAASRAAAAVLESTLEAAQPQRCVHTTCRRCKLDVEVWLDDDAVVSVHDRGGASRCTDSMFGPNVDHIPAL